MTFDVGLIGFGEAGSLALDEPGLDPAMTRGTIVRQRRLGALGKLTLIDNKEDPPT